MCLGHDSRPDMPPCIPHFSGISFPIWLFVIGGAVLWVPWLGLGEFWSLHPNFSQQKPHQLLLGYCRGPPPGPDMDPEHQAGEGRSRSGVSKICELGPLGLIDFSQSYGWRPLRSVLLDAACQLSVPLSLFRSSTGTSEPIPRLPPNPNFNSIPLNFGLHAKRISLLQRMRKAPTGPTSELARCLRSPGIQN